MSSGAERLSSASNNPPSASLADEGTSAAITVRALGMDSWQAGVEQDWDRWPPLGHLTLTRRFLDCARRVEMEGFRVMPLVLSDRVGRTVGVAASYLNTIDGADLGKGTVQRAIHLLRSVSPRFLKYGVIEIGNPVGMGFPVRTSLSSTEAITALAGWAIKETERQGASLVVIRDIVESAAPNAVAELKRLGFVPSPLPATFILPLPFASFDEYKAHMRSGYRSRLTGCMKATASLRVEVVDDFASLAPQLLALWRNLYDRATQYRRLVMTESFFEAASKMDEAKVMLLRRPDDSIAGFGLLFLDGPMLRFSVTGFTRDAALQEGVYFRILYEVVRYAIENGCRAVNMGVTTSGPKMSVGALPVHLQAWIWHRSALRRQALGWMSRTLIRPIPPVERNVFREDVSLFMDPALTE